MSEFFKHVAGKLAGTAFDLYKHQTIRKYRGQIADEFAKAIRSVAKGSRWFLWGLVMLVPFLAAGFLLLAFGLFAIVYGVAPDAQKGLVCIVGGAGLAVKTAADRAGYHVGDIRFIKRLNDMGKKFVLIGHVEISQPGKISSNSVLSEISFK